MHKVIKLAAICCSLLVAVFIMGCGEDSTSPTKVKKEDDSAISLSASHIESLNGESFGASIAQELDGQGIKLSEASTVWSRVTDEEWLITDTENGLAYVVKNSGGDKLEVNKTSFIDYQGEAETIVKFWEEYRNLYNKREITKLLTLWNKKGSDHIYINISENEPLSGDGAEGVRNVLLKLSKGHHSTKSDNWKGSPMNEVYIKKRGSTLVASATGPNAFRNPGQTWAYFVKNDIGKWKVSKVESIEQRNMGKHDRILIHEKDAEDKIGYFDDKKTRVK